jgi:hypothetical protein
MVDKSGTQTFTQSWSKTVNWAKQAGIPQSAYYPVYQLDSQRLLTGTPMSESERIRAIQAASGLNYSSALPTDTHSDSAVVANVKTNAANIFTGLDPISLVKNIFDTITNTVEHPSSLLHPLALHSLASWIPGLTDFAELMEGKAGLNTLLQNPLTSLLDVLPLTDYLPKILAHTDQGIAMAAKLGIAPDELSKMSAAQLSWALGKKLPLKNQGVIATTDAAGQTSLASMTVGDQLNLYRNAKNVGSEQSELNKGLISAEQKGTKLVEDMTRPMIEAIGRLSPADKDLALQIYKTDFRSPEDIALDPSIPPQVRNALDATFSTERQALQLQMQAGKIADVKTKLVNDQGVVTDQLEKYLVTPGSRGEKVLRAGTLSDEAHAAHEAASTQFNSLLIKVDQSDKSLDRFVSTLHSTSAAVFQSIKASISSLPDDAAERARQALPSAERWDRTVPSNTVVLRNLLGLGPDERISLHSMNAIRDLFSPGGLIDQIYKAYENHDFKSMSDYSKVAVRKFDNKVFKSLPGGPNGHLLQIRNTLKGLQQYSLVRSKLMTTMDRLWNGKSKFDKTSISYLAAAAQKADQHFIETSIRNPPGVWKSAYNDELVRQVQTSEKAANLIPDTLTALHKQDPNAWPDTAVSKLEADPRTIIELVSRASKDSYGNPMLPDLPVALWKEMSDNAYNELASLRARGLVPHYLPHLSPNDINKEARPTYNLKLSALRPKSEAAIHENIFDYSSSVSDIQLGFLKGAKEALHDDVLQEFHEEWVKPHLHNAADLRALLANYLAPDIQANSEKVIAGTATDNVDALIQDQLKKMGLVTWKPESVFGNLSLPKMDAEYYIDGNLAKAMESTVQKMDNPTNNIMDKGTNLFRHSILGLSPRFTLHITVGGSVMVAFRGNKEMFSFLRDAVHYGRTGKLTDETLAKYPGLGERIDSAFGTSSSQEGAEDMKFHYLGGKQLGNLAIDEHLANHPHIQGALARLKAAANLNFKFTRAVTKAQKALVYLAGFERALKDGSFYDDVYTPQLDAAGNPVRHPITGKEIYSHSREKVDMTADQAHEAGMQAAMSVMGDMRHMTPLERGALLRIFPFYGWTKHILSYVLSYPADHPYRATFLSQLATQDSSNIPSGLDTRIQLLFFLGQPDAQGNVSAVDTRFLDPFRDTANYASWTGFFESLNPIIAAPIAAIDPNASFGGTPLYTNLTFNSLYGIKAAGPQGNIFTSIEQIVPQVSALDAALNLSGQYSYLKTNDPGGFAKMVANALNVPFADVQKINLRQMAAKSEISRYQIAEADAYNALTTGDFSTLDKYPAGATVPDPLGTQYNVTPAYLKALYNQTEKQYGLPPTEALPPLPTPAI